MEDAYFSLGLQIRLLDKYNLIQLKCNIQGNTKYYEKIVKRTVELDLIFLTHFIKPAWASVSRSHFSVLFG